MSQFESYGRYLHCRSEDASLPPVYLWVESKEEGVSKDEVVLSYASNEESHSVFLVSPLDFEPTVLSDFSLLVFHSINIVDGDWFG